jgi:hypothetical protein
MRPRHHVLPLALAALLAGSLTAVGPRLDGPPSIARAGGSAAAPTADGPATPVTSVATRPFRIDLADGNDFVAQTNYVQCVGASMQMMVNIMGGNDRSGRTQTRLQVLARSLSGPTRAGFERKGASVAGWTSGLNQLGAGPYRLAGVDTLDEALRLAARSIRATGKPVGLLVWAGRHAWVMSGFEATADPRATDHFRVTRAIVLDPLHPHGSTRWGPSPRPRAGLTPAVLGRQFVPRRRGTWAGAATGVMGQSLAWLAGKYVIVIPYTPISLARNRVAAV